MSDRILITGGAGFIGSHLAVRLVRDGYRVKVRLPAERDNDMLRPGLWELYHDQEELQPMPTPESKNPSPASVYALSKFDQERLSLMIGAYAIPTTALRG